MEGNKVDGRGRPTLFKMEIQGSLLEALGVNLYSSIGKCLVEFAANAYDSDSPKTEITIPFDTIKRERDRIRGAARQRAQSPAMKGKPLVVLDPLPQEVYIVIQDRGHGMRADEIQSKFLPLNRNRRQGASEEESAHLQTTESGKRLVMGRKGLGKLAAFGVAQQVTIYSKREGDTYATEFTMDFDQIRNSPRLHEVPFVPRYHEGLDPADKGTRITLSKLRCDAVGTGEGGVVSALQDNFFGIEAAEFKIELNGRGIGPETANYEFLYPEFRPFDDFAEATIEVPDGLGSFKIRYVAKYRAREEGKRNHLPATKRGARFYCNGRLAAGPSLLDLHSGKHNFQATAYLEVVVRADELDALGVDLINTNRTDFRRDNEVVNGLLQHITTFMEESLAAHSKFRDAKAEEELSNSAIGRMLEAQISGLPRKTQTPARKLIRLLARYEGVESETFKTTAPLVIQSVNTGEVLVRLLELSQRDSDLKEVIVELHRLAVIERSDALKLYRARRNGLLALQKLIRKGDELWKDNPKFESELHELLERCPWMLAEEMGRYVASDVSLATTLQRLEQHLGINRSASNPLDPNTRPDLVFLLGDSAITQTVVIVELKSPNIALTANHWTQLDKYISEIELWASTEITDRKIRIKGILVGTPPERKTRNSDENLFLKWWEQEKNPQITVIPLMQLLDTAVAANQAQLETLEAEDEA